MLSFLGQHLFFVLTFLSTVDHGKIIVILMIIGCITSQKKQNNFFNYVFSPFHYAKLP